MPVLAVPGAAAAAPAAPAAARAAGPATTLPFGRAGDAVDLVSLSPAARLRQALDVPALVMRQLGALLGEFERISVPGRAPAPLVLGALAGEIGSSARTLGAGVQALLPTPDAPTPVQLGAAAALRVLATLAPAQAGSPDARAQDAPARDAPAPDAGGKDAPFQDVRPDARPAATVRPDPALPGVAPAAPGRAAAFLATVLPGADGGADAAALMPSRLDAPDPGTPIARDPAARTSGDAPRPLPGTHDPARPDSARPDSARPNSARPASARVDATRTAYARVAPAQAEPARPDPARQLRDAALVLLREASATLGRMQLRPRGFPAEADRLPGRAAEAGRDEAWCDAQIAAALGQVAQASWTLSGVRPAGRAGLGAALGRGAAAPGEAGRAARSWTWLALLFGLGVALWATQSLDFGVARALTAAGLGAGAAAWGWRRAAGRRVRVELR